MNKKMIIVLPVEEFEGEIADIMRNFSESKKNGIYLCLNKPINYRIELLNRQKININNVFFIDSISGMEKEEGNTIFLGNISSKKIISAIAKMIVGEPKKDYLFIESLRTLEIYEGEAGLSDFLMKLNKKIIENKMDMIALATNHTEHGKILTYFDKVINIK